MKITIELNNVKVEKNIPVRWEEVTFSQFLEILEAPDLASRLSVFTGVDAELLKKAKISNLEVVTGLLSFLDNTEIEMSNIPKEVAGYKMPANLGMETIGQFEDMKSEAAKIKDKSKESLKAYAMFCAIYATNPYDYKEAESKLEIFMNAPCVEVLAIGNFTLVKLIESSNPSLKEALRPPSQIKKLKLAMKGWLSRLVFTARYFSWKRKLRIKGMSY
jgi:hypothetical protein